MDVDPEGITLSEMSDRDKQILYDLTYMWNLKNKRKNKTHRKRDQTYSYQKWGEERRENWRKVVKRCKFPVIR